MIHQLERGADGRTHCATCRWSWAAKGSIRANGCPGVPRYGGYESAVKAGLKTFTMLRKAGLKTDLSQPAGCIYVQGRREWVWLYDERTAVPRRKASEAQKAAAAKGRAVALARITCKDCGEVARGREERRFLRRHGCCEGCWWEQQIRYDHDAAIKEARARLAVGTLILDTETTGLEPHDTVVELAIINTAGETLFHSLIHPESPMSPEAQALHGLESADLEEAPRFNEVWEHVKPLLVSQPFAAYNSDFDARMLASSAHQTGVHLPLGWADKAACLMDLYAAYRGELLSDEGEYRWVTLTAACHEERIPPGQHSALSDAQAALALLKALASKDLLRPEEAEASA
jgi:DNA polymerase III subunit epsilon